MLTAEKLHLLLTRPDGRSEARRLHGVALAAAALADLRAAGVVDFEDARPAAEARIRVVAGGTAGHPVLDALLPQADALAGTPVAAAVGKGRPRATKPVIAHLVETGVLRTRPAFLDTRHVPASPTTRAELVTELTAVVRGEREGSEQDLLLLGLLHHLNVLRRLLPEAQGDQSRRDLTRRLEALSREDVLAQAVRRSVSTTAATAAAAPLSTERPVGPGVTVVRG
ncbi:GPP34 family phosphoprotein [Micrococcus sp.]|uniref:GPP34 family phosphoprotein n=1 Tax=Micrococcus sp. TaxID=1271 RepID=UPI002A91D17D|nr:GPP34 family phosphoprotein [Micrococcus sp.]MDY6055366.1 GPP34 family phosphoprotein [Micrococcus sp.]